MSVLTIVFLGHLLPWHRPDEAFSNRYPKHGFMKKFFNLSKDYHLVDVKANPKDFYQYINSQKKDTQGIPPLKKRNGSGVTQSESEKVAESNGQFNGQVCSLNPNTVRSLF